MPKTVLLPQQKLLRLDIVIPTLAFVIPLIIPGPQWLTGILVNCLLFLFVTRLEQKNMLPIVILPSLGAFLHGVIFGPLTMFLVFFLPFIWLGNYLLIAVFRRLEQRPYIFRIVIASIAKAALLYAIASLYFGLQIVPKFFVTSMGLIQFITAIGGGILSYSIITLMKNTHE